MRDREQEYKLINAVNLICEFVSENLPFGWNIEITAGVRDCYIELIDHSGEEVQCDSESGVSILSLMCETANDIEQDKAMNQ